VGGLKHERTQSGSGASLSERWAVDASLALAWVHPSQASDKTDAAYLELALRQHLPLGTVDASLQEAARRAGVNLLVS
jgi:hypothetical protein